MLNVSQLLELPSPRLTFETLNSSLTLSEHSVKHPRFMDWHFPKFVLIIKVVYMLKLFLVESENLVLKGSLEDATGAMWALEHVKSFPFPQIMMPTSFG